MLLCLFGWVWDLVPTSPMISGLQLLIVAAIRSGTPGSLSLAFRGSPFWSSKSPRGSLFSPQHTKVGHGCWCWGWLTSFTRLCRGVTCHAPIGEYHAKFNVDAPIHCDCSYFLHQMRDHLVHVCRNVTRLHQRQGVGYLTSFVGLLGANLGLFAFTINFWLVWDPGCTRHALSAWF
jgi:hypothetical protein